MSLTTPRTKLAAALLGLTLAAAAVAPAAAPAQATGTDPARQDLRSPDTRDAAERYDPAPRQDLRSPDARDAALGYDPVALPQTLSGPSTAPAAAAGFDWASAGIGAAGGAAILLALLAVGSLRGHGRPSLGF